MQERLLPLGVEAFDLNQEPAALPKKQNLRISESEPVADREAVVSRFELLAYIMMMEGTSKSANTIEIRLAKI